MDVDKAAYRVRDQFIQKNLQHSLLLSAIFFIANLKLLIKDISFTVISQAPWLSEADVHHLSNKFLL